MNHITDNDTSEASNHSRFPLPSRMPICTINIVGLPLPSLSANRFLIAIRVHAIDSLCQSDIIKIKILRYVVNVPTSFKVKNISHEGYCTLYNRIYRLFSGYEVRLHMKCFFQRLCLCEK